MHKKEFDLLADKLGSPFAAVNYVAKSARKLRKEIEYPILESEAISWAITGEKPKANGRKHSYSQYDINILDDILSEVDDDEVSQSVRNSYEESLQAHHLIYCYHTNLDESRKARVRVLLNMIWYNIKSEGGFT